MITDLTEHIRQINYTSQGMGPPVILVHGIASSLYDWDLLMPELARGGFGAYALDLLGHGDSAKRNTLSNSPRPCTAWF
jgi:pimeloyl-ACP methyl ester carboxylesterase